MKELLIIPMPTIATTKGHPCYLIKALECIRYSVTVLIHPRGVHQSPAAFDAVRFHAGSNSIKRKMPMGDLPSASTLFDVLSPSAISLFFSLFRITNVVPACLPALQSPSKRGGGICSHVYMTVHRARMS